MRFSIISAEEAAREELAKIKQGKDVIPAYVARFRQYVDRTKYGPIELHNRFYCGLNKQMQELLIHHSEPIDMLEKLQEACEGIQRRLDKFRCVHHHNTSAGVIASPSQSSGVVPMEVDALKKGN